MAETPDSTAVHAFVDRLADQAEERLTTSAADAKARHSELTRTAKKAGNHLRSDDIRAALDAEGRFALDARALAGRMPHVKRAMSADLERLLAVSLGQD